MEIWDWVGEYVRLIFHCIKIQKIRRFHILGEVAGPRPERVIDVYRLSVTPHSRLSDKSIR